MRKNRIYAYNTHYEIYDYTLGEHLPFVTSSDL
jgi:hypothetical protein